MGRSSQLRPGADEFGDGVESALAGALAELFPRASASAKSPQDHWADGSALVEHGDLKDLEERIAERFPTPEALAEFDPDMIVSVYGFRDAGSTDGSAAAGDGVQDLHTFPPQPVRDAVGLYHDGHTIIAWRMLEHLPEALERATDILSDLGMPSRPLSARGLAEPWNSTWPFVLSLVYSPGGQTSGLGLHYDRFDSVVVHMRGAKRWRIGRSPYLSYPMWNEEAAAQLDHPPSLPRLATRTDMVTDLEDIEMRPGSALMLPRGTYHTTLADDEASLSIGYHFALPTWTHIVVGALQFQLSRDPVLRTTPLGAFSPDGPSAEALEAMGRVTERVRDVLRDPAGLLEGLLGDLASHHQAVFRVPDDIAARLLPGDPPVVVDYAGADLKIELPAESGPLCEWLVAAAPRAFGFDEALDASARRMSPRAVWDLLQEAVEAGVLERWWGHRADEPAGPAGT